MRRFARPTLLAASILAILVATLHTAGSSIPRGWTFAITSGEAALAEAIQNLLLFIPFGMSLALVFPLSRRERGPGGEDVARRQRGPGGVTLFVALLGAALSFAVEFTQQWIPGRDPSTGDILCNTVSTLIGAALVWTAPRWLTVSGSRARLQALLCALAAVTIWLATGFLLRPLVPDPPWSVVETPNWNYWGHYRGAVRTLAVTPTNLRVQVIAPATPADRESPLVAIMDHHTPPRPVRVLIIEGKSLALRYHTRAGDWTLEPPDLRWRRVLTAIAPGDTFTVEAWQDRRDGHSTCLMLNETWRRCGLGYTIGDGWRLIFDPYGWPDWALAIINACWIAGLVIGVGFWTGRGLIPVGIVIAGLIAVPMVTGLNATPLLEWIGALLGIGAARASRLFDTRPRRAS